MINKNAFTRCSYELTFVKWVIIVFEFQKIFLVMLDPKYLEWFQHKFSGKANFKGWLVFKLSMVRIIASHFTNCGVNSSYCSFKVVNHTKNVKQFFPQQKFNSSTLYFSISYLHYIHILFIHCRLLSKEILLIPKIT